MDKTDEKMVHIYTVEDQVQQSLVEDALSQADIEYSILDQDNLEWMQAAEFHESAQIWVLEEDADKAKEIIENTLSE